MSVFLDNVDDFITPSQACINPLVSSKLNSTSVEPNPATKSSNGRVTVSLDFTKSEFEAKSSKPDLIKSRISGSKKVATVSLNDCLACRFVNLILFNYSYYLTS